MMNLKTNILLKAILLLGVCPPVMAQVQLTPVLVGSSGGSGNAGSMHISWSAGETVITTEAAGSTILTQGFHQPRAQEAMTISVTSTDATCKTSNDGTAKINVFNGNGPFTYTWTPAVTSGDSATGLEAGSYSVLVTDAFGQTDTANFTINVNNDADCLVHIYNGFTPNGDGRNDKWEIDGITFFPDNTVSIFNRWGDRVWEASAYDNASVIWDGHSNEGDPLPEGTYFYVITLPDSQYTGWVEVTR